MRLVWHKLTRGASQNEPLRLWLLGTPTPVIDAIRRAVSTPQEYRYGAYNRPPGFGATPPGILRVDPPVPGQHKTRHGVVVYGRKLTDKEVYDYELVPYLPLADVVERTLTQLGEYAEEYARFARKGETDLLAGIDAPAPFYTDTDAVGIERAVVAALLAKYPAPPPVAPVAAPPKLSPPKLSPPKLSRMPGGFGGFDTGEGEEPVKTWQYLARQALTTAMKGEGQNLHVPSLLRPGETLPSVEPHGFYFIHRTGYDVDHAALLFAPEVANEAQAEKVAKALQRKMIAKKKAEGLAYYAHRSRIVIAGPTGAWSFAPLDDGAPRARRLQGEGDTVTAAKERLIMAAREAEVFTDILITGSAEKGYTLHMRPRPIKKTRFAAESMRIRDWESAHAAVTEAAARVKAAIAKYRDHG